MVAAGKQLVVEKEDQIYKAQGSPWVKFIAWDRWVAEELIPRKGEGVSIEELHQFYTHWVKTQDEWNEDVLDNRIGFAKKLNQVLAARAWGYTYERKASRRGINRLQLK